MLLRNEGDATTVNLVVIGAAEDANPPTRQQVTDSAGRASAPVTGGGALPSADAHQIEEQRFAFETADELRRAALAGDFDRLIVMAPPRTLGYLRKNYHLEVQKRTVREVGKDMTGHPIGEIEKMLFAMD